MGYFLGETTPRGKLNGILFWGNNLRRKIVTTIAVNRRWVRAGLVFSLAALGLLAAAVQAAPPQNQPAEAGGKLRPLRVAIFNVDALKGVDTEGTAIADQLDTMMSALSDITMLNREQIKKVADEHQIALSGMVDNSTAVKLGKFLSAQYLIVGRASKIGQTYYLVLKIIDVETTQQSTVSAKADAASGFQAVLQRIDEPLAASIRRLQRPTTETEDNTVAELRQLAKPLVGKVLLLRVEEFHVGRPLHDPAAQMAIMQRLRSLGLTVVAPADPVPGWKESLLETGKYGDQKVDFLLEGEGASTFAAQLHGLTSCRARVELR